MTKADLGPLVNRSALKPDGQPVALLLVEDDLDQQALMVLILQNLGYEVHAVDNGLQALEVLETWTPDLVVTDIMMPEMDGVSFVREMRASEELKHIPILVLTAIENSDTECELLDLGVDEYLEKTTPRKLLKRRVDKAIRSRQKDGQKQEKEDN
jgi:CheY-like chemotaxis protein